MKLKSVIAATAVVFAAPVLAQDAALPLQVELAQPAVSPATVLPANTEILFSMNQEVTTKGKRWNEGDTFNMSVVHDVRFGDYVVIPRGSRGVGRITFLTDKGMFGKSGKMDVELDYVEVAGRRINVNGTYRQEGEGNTLATVAGVVLVGVFGGFITGKSAVIPQGRELMAHTESDLALALPSNVQAPATSAPMGVIPVADPNGNAAAQQAAIASANWRRGN